MNSDPTPKSISSQVSAAGLTPSASQDGQTSAPSGRAVALANRFRRQGASAEPTTSAISGPLFTASSPSASLQWSLESRLRTILEGRGSPEYALTWKTWDLPLGPPISRLQASARRTAASASSGWHTPRARGDAQGARWASGAARNLEDQARMAGGQSYLSPAPTARRGALNPAFSLWLMGFPSQWMEQAPSIESVRSRARATL